LIDALTLNAGTLHTQGADLNLQGALTLDNNSLIDSTGGTLTLGGTVDNSSELTVPGTALALRSDFAITGTLSTGTGTSISRNNNELDLSGGLLKLGGNLNLAGTVTDNDTRLILQANATLGNSASTGIGSLDLNGSALSISMAMTINDPLTLDASSEQLLTGANALSLNNHLDISAGKLSSTSGIISFGSTASLGSAGTIDIQGGELHLSDNISVTSGTLTVSDTSKLSLQNDVTVSTNTPMSVGTLEMNDNNFNISATQGADLTIKKAFSLDNGSTLQMNGADLTMTEYATISGILEPSGGTLLFSKGGSVSGTVNSKNSTLSLQTANLVFTGLLQTNGSTTLSGASLLNLSNGTLEVEGSLTLDDVTTSNSTALELTDHTTISRDSSFTVGSVDLSGKTLTLGSTNTDLTIENSAPTEGGSAGTFQMQGADLTWTGVTAFSAAKVYSAGGTLTLASGSSLSSTGLIDLSNGSTLVLNGAFGQSGGELTADNSTLETAGDFSKTGGTLTSNNATFKLNGNVTASSNTPLSFKAVTLNNNVLSFGAQTDNLTLTEELTLNDPNGRIEQGSTALQLNGGVSIDSGGVLRLTDVLNTGSSKVKLNGGLLAIDNDTTLASSILHLAASTLEIAQTKTLTYEGASIEIGASALSIIGGGNFTNTNPLELDHGQSQLNLSGIFANYIRTDSNSLGISVDNSSTVNDFSVEHVTPVSISPNQSFNGLIEVYSNSNLQLNNTGTLAADVKISGLGGKLEAQDNMTFTGSLQQVNLHEGFELKIASGKTMTYSGSEFGIGNHTFKLTGGGTLDNTNNLKLDDPGSLLAISDSTKISRLLVNASGTNGGMTISSSVSSSTGNLVGNLSLSDSFSVSSDSVWSVDNITADTTLTFSTDKNVNFGALTLTGSADFSLGTGDITLSVSSPVTVGNTQKLQNGGGSFNFLGGLSLETGSELIGQGKQVSGNIVLNGGQIATEQNTVLTDNLTQSADSTIEIDPSKTLTYSGAVVDIGTSTLNVQGGGSFINSAVSALSLNNAGSHLVLDNVTVGFVTASAASNS